jgi:large subunit ribosomal protein L13
MRTKIVNLKDIGRTWVLIDAKDAVLGRLASRVSGLLMGKHKPAVSPNQDHGDFVIVVNSDKVRLTGKKALTKEYFRNTRHPGGGKFRPFQTQMDLDSTKVIIHAVKGMIPKNALGRQMIRKLHVYQGEAHPHAAQKPQPVQVHG